MCHEIKDKKKKKERNEDNIFVMGYSKRNLTALATSYWFGMNRLPTNQSTVISVQQSFQVKRFNMIRCKL